LIKNLLIEIYGLMREMRSNLYWVCRTDVLLFVLLESA